MTDEKKVLHGPWTDMDGYQFRISANGPEWRFNDQDTWTTEPRNSWAGFACAELARLAAENAEQKKVIDAYEATIGDSAEWLAERDRLRAKYADLESMYDNHREGQRWGPWELLALALEATVGYRIAGLKRFMAQARAK
jgi:hypothetical protein